MRFNAKVASLMIGLAIGGTIGGVTNTLWPNVGVALEAHERVLVCAAAGGFIGLLAGFAVDRR